MALNLPPRIAGLVEPKMLEKMAAAAVTRTERAE